jgi:hypothetical protein
MKERSTTGWLQVIAHEMSEFRAQMKSMDQRFSTLQSDVTSLQTDSSVIQKSLSDIFEHLGRENFLSQVKQQGQVEFLYPVGGKKDIPGKADVESEYSNLYNLLPSPPSGQLSLHEKRLYEQYGKLGKAVPRFVEIDIVAKFVYLTKDRSECKTYSSPTATPISSPVTPVKSEPSSPMPTTHLPRVFHGLAIGEVSRSSNFMNSAKDFKFDLLSPPAQLTPTVMLVSKFLQLERAISSLNYYYEPKQHSAPVKYAALISPSFKYTKDAGSLIEKVFELNPGAFPNLKHLARNNGFFLLPT